MIYQSIMQWFSSYFNRSSWIWVAFLWKTSPEMNHLLPWVLIIENLENNSSEAVTATLKFGKAAKRVLKERRPKMESSNIFPTFLQVNASLLNRRGTPAIPFLKSQRPKTVANKQKVRENLKKP
ncbi:uncharacterized protein LOC117909308 isoform X2 [Vitis riparia]|uniref:uncharacterized protein LOC117909308 isoform X2 n=1 Tax=Vitis riparia TaxID=96939 RepID=UPI00155B3707|nr:uncharacterized protein LOC117909308 isoform X2 [Vitis riparia]